MHTFVSLCVCTLFLTDVMGNIFIYSCNIFYHLFPIHRIKHNKYNYAVRVGIGQGTGGVLIPIRRVLLHPASLHGLSHTDANLALIHLKQAITFHSGVVLPVCLSLSPAYHRPASGSPSMNCGGEGTHDTVEEESFSINRFIYQCFFYKC